MVQNRSATIPKADALMQRQFSDNFFHNFFFILEMIKEVAVECVIRNTQKIGNFAVEIIVTDTSKALLT